MPQIKEMNNQIQRKKEHVQTKKTQIKNFENKIISMTPLQNNYIYFKKQHHLAFSLTKMLPTFAGVAKALHVGLKKRRILFAQGISRTSFSVSLFGFLFMLLKASKQALMLVKEIN